MDSDELGDEKAVDTAIRLAERDGGVTVKEFAASLDYNSIPTAHRIIKHCIKTADLICEDTTESGRRDGYLVYTRGPGGKQTEDWVTSRPRIRWKKEVEDGS